MTMTINGSGTIGGLVAGGLPDATITQPDLAAGVAGNGPVFRAQSGTNQTGITNATFTKVVFDTETFDTNNNFSSSRFTPTVAGYYQINSVLDIGQGAVGLALVRIYKNGASISYGNGTTANSSEIYVGVNDIVYCNGSTDYIEIYGYVSSSSNVFYSGSFFSGALVRAA